MNSNQLIRAIDSALANFKGARNNFYRVLANVAAHTIQHGNVATANHCLNVTKGDKYGLHDQVIAFFTKYGLKHDAKNGTFKINKEIRAAITDKDMSKPALLSEMMNSLTTMEDERKATIKANKPVKSDTDKAQASVKTLKKLFETIDIQTRQQLVMELAGLAGLELTTRTVQDGQALAIAA